MTRSSYLGRSSQPFCKILFLFSKLLEIHIRRSWFLNKRLKAIRSRGPRRKKKIFKLRISPIEHSTRRRGAGVGEATHDLDCAGLNEYGFCLLESRANE